MITILHGDNESAIHKELFALLQAARNEGVEIIRLSSKKLEIPELEAAVGSAALFSDQKLVVIDGIFSLPKSKRKEALLAYIRDQILSEVGVLLIEKKALTPAQIKLFPTAKCVLFKYPAVMFSWLETIGARPEKSLELFHQVLEREDAQVCFIMLIRQVRTLLAFVSDGTFNGPPFLRAKIASQARMFTKDRLMELHRRLLELDEKQKTSQLSLSLSANLDLILTVV